MVALIGAGRNADAQNATDAGVTADAQPATDATTPTADSVAQPVVPFEAKPIAATPYDNWYFLKDRVVPFYSFFTEYVRRIDARTDYVNDKAEQVEARKGKITSSTPTLDDLGKKSKPLATAISKLKGSKKQALEAYLQGFGKVALETIDALVPMVEAMADNNNKDKLLVSPIFDPFKVNVRKVLASCVFGTDTSAISAKEESLKKLRAELAAEKDIGKKVGLEDSIKTSERELGVLKRTESPTCPSETMDEIVGFITSISELDISELSTEVKTEVTRLLSEATNAKRADEKIVFASHALQLIPPVVSGNMQCKDCASNDMPCGMIGKRLLGSKRPKWLPPFDVRLAVPLLIGSGTDNRNGMGFKVDSRGYALDLELNVEGLWRFSQSVATIYGAGISVGYRKTAFIDETMPNSVSSTFVTFAGRGKLGLNFANWVSVYFLAEGIAAPAGYGMGGGVDITGVPGMVFGVRTLYEYTHNQANTGAVRSNPADFKGFVLVPNVGVLF
jgi:hypothetical protein